MLIGDPDFVDELCFRLAAFGKAFYFYEDGNAFFVEPDDVGDPRCIEMLTVDSTGRIKGAHGFYPEEPPIPPSV